MSSAAEHLKDVFRETAERIRNGYGGNSDTIDGVEINVATEVDYDNKPEDFDCYSDEDAERFNNYGWEFTVVTLRIQVEGIEVGDASVGCVEHNLTEDAEGEIEHLAEDILPALFSEAAEMVPSHLRRIETAADSLRGLVATL